MFIFVQQRANGTKGIQSCKSDHVIEILYIYVQEATKWWPIVSARFHPPQKRESPKYVANIMWGVKAV